MKVPNDIKTFCNAVSKATGLAMVVIWAWMISENGAQKDAIDPDNNPLNIRYTGNLRPQETGWLYLKTVSGIKENGVVVYPTLQDGIDATIIVLSEHYYDNIRAVAIANPTAFGTQGKAIQDSPWDADHYFQATEPPGHILQNIIPIQDADFSDDPIEVPNPGAEGIPDSNEHKAAAALLVSTAYTALWNTLDTQASRDFVHYQLMALRSYLASHGIGSVNADGRLIYQGVTASYNI